MAISQRGPQPTAPDDVVDAEYLAAQIAAAMPPAAGLNTVGYGKMIFIPHGGTIPTGLDPYTVVIELGA